MGKCVYLIKAENGRYKIGLTSRLDDRLNALRLQSPVSLELIHTAESEQAPILETHLHRIFSDRRTHGEWFDLSDADVEKFKTITTAGIPKESLPKMPEDAPPYLTTAEAADILGISVQGVIAAIKRDSLKAEKIGQGRRGTWIIERAEVERYKDERHTPRVVAAALQPERLAEVAEGMQEAELL